MSISRRRFIKQALAFLALLSGGGFAAMQALNRDTVVQADSPPAEPPVEPSEPAAPDAAEPASQELLLSFFLLSDLHISAGESSMSDRLHAALKDIVNFESNVDTIVLGGDLTDFGRDVDYKLLRKILDQYKLPKLYANMGNHDYYDIWLTKQGAFSTDTVPNGKTDAMSRERFQKFIGYADRPYYEEWVQGVHLIMLSQECYVEERPEVGEGAWYSDEQLAWLEETMKSHADGQPAIVFIHQPLPEPGADGGTHRLIRAKRFRAILEPYANVFVLSGHTHRNFRTESHYNSQNSFHWFNNASVGRTRSAKPGDSSLIAQGMYVQVYGHQVVVRGREFSDRSWIESAEWTIPLAVPARV